MLKYLMTLHERLESAILEIRFFHGIFNYHEQIKFYPCICNCEEPLKELCLKDSIINIMPTSNQSSPCEVTYWEFGPRCFHRQSEHAAVLAPG